MATHGDVGDIWRHMATYGDIWRLWRDMATYADIWRHMVTWRRMATYGDTWRHMVTCRSHGNFGHRGRFKTDLKKTIFRILGRHVPPFGHTGPPCNRVVLVRGRGEGCTRKTPPCSSFPSPYASCKAWPRLGTTLSTRPGRLPIRGNGRGR